MSIEKMLIIFFWVIVVGLIIAIFWPSQSEAGIFSPREWTIEEVRETYNTPEKLGQFIRRQFISERGLLPKHSAEEVLKSMGGNCRDMAHFVKDILEPLGYECEIVADNRVYNYGRAHCVCEVKDGNKTWVFSGTEYKQKRRGK